MERLRTVKTQTADAGRKDSEERFGWADSKSKRLKDLGLLTGLTQVDRIRRKTRRREKSQGVKTLTRQMQRGKTQTKQS